MFQKKRFGQHFLTENHIAEEIVSALEPSDDALIIEVGPGRGVLTQFLEKKYKKLKLIELDERLIPFLKNKFPSLQHSIIESDVLKINFDQFPENDIMIIGNFPYNISTQIIFKIIEHKNKISQMAGMFQKEVAERIAATHGNKSYGVTSVLTQVFFEVEYLFEVAPDAFNPPPKVDSAVIKLSRKPMIKVNESKLKQIVKAAFNQRRKKLSNALKGILPKEVLQEALFDKRAEALSVEEYVYLANRNYD